MELENIYKIKVQINTATKRYEKKNIELRIINLCPKCNDKFWFSQGAIMSKKDQRRMDRDLKNIAKEKGQKI